MRITPTQPQHDFITSSAKYPAFVGGYGSGKTEALVTRGIIQKLKYPTTNRAFYEPTYDLIRMIAFPRWEEKLTELNIPYKLTKSPQNTIDIEGYGTIYFRSMDIPHRIIGYEVGDSDVDELDTLKPENADEVFNKIIARNRQKKPNGGINTVAVATTPEGFKFTHRKWVKDRLPGYEIIKAPTYSNPYLPEDYVQTLRDIYPANLIEAYLEGNFVNLKTGTVYHCYDREKNKSAREIKFLPEGGVAEPLWIGMDFNVGKMAAIIHVKDEDGRFHAVDEIINAYDTPDICRIIKERYWKYEDGVYRKTYDMRVYPDSTGGSRKSVDASITDIAELQRQGFAVHGPSANPPVKDRINAMNALFCNSEGIRSYFVNDIRCSTYADCLEQQAWDDKGEPDKSNDLDHPVDAAGYLISYECPVIKPVARIDMRMGV